MTANYVITTEPGTLSVDPRDLTIRAKDATFDYDGAAHSEPNYEAIGLVAGDVLEVIIQGAISHPDQNPVENIITGYRFTLGDENNYNVTTINGKLTMNAVPEHELIIHYMDEDDNILSEDYSGTYKEDTDYGPIDSPIVKGYTPDYSSIYGTMGKTDVELTVVYRTEGSAAVTENGSTAGDRGTPAGLVSMDDNGVPIVNAVDEGDIPMAASLGHWALLNLLSMILTALISLLLLIFIFVRKRRKDDDPEDEKTEDAEETKVKKRVLLRLLGVIPAVAAILLFFLTEDMSQPMILSDKWTIAMIFILFVEFIVAIAARKKEDDDNEDQERQRAY